MSLEVVGRNVVNVSEKGEVVVGAHGGFGEGSEIAKVSWCRWRIGREVGMVAVESLGQ